MTMMAGPTSSSATWARTVFTTTITTARLPTSPRRPASRWETGRPARTWGDYDGDGRLDLFVTGYVHFDRNNLPYEKTKAVGFSYCEFRGAPVMCGPKNIEGEPDHLFHNNGDGTFTDVSVKAGVSDETNRYYGFTPVFVDVNNDGKVDLVVADDSTLSYLYLNRGDGTFEDASYASGFGLNEDGREVAAMGIAVGDYLNNGLVDFAISDFSDEAKLLFHNDGNASFTEMSMRSGIGKKSIPFLGWGTGFLGLRQRRLARSDVCQRPHLSRGRQTGLGNVVQPEAASVSQSARRQI